MKYMILLILAFTLSASAYDLGGKCEPVFKATNDPWTELRAAEAAKDWQKVVRLKKVYVRNMCDNDHRWLDLANNLLKINKSNETTEILGDLHKKGYELKAENLKFFPELVKHINSKQFRESEAGQALTKAEGESKARRKAFQEQLAKLGSSMKPPSEYLAKDVCPFECCTYREWTVEKNVTLFDLPRGSKNTSELKQGEKVNGVTGQVYVRPTAVGIVFDHPPFKKGDIVFLLDYQGEGYFHYWHQGKIGSDELSGASEDCLRPSKECWAQFIEGNAQASAPDWWVKVKLNNGKTGWTNKVESFGNMDACG